MKIIILSLFSITLFYSAKSQNIGIRANTSFSGNREINNSLGAGLYLNIEDSSSFFGGILFVDYFSNNKEFHDCIECLTTDITTSWQNLSFGIGGLWIKSIHSNVRFKFGPLVNYSIADVKRQGQIAAWIETIKSNYIGTGVLLNLQFQQLFTLPLNLDIFLSPTYLINIYSETKPSEIKSDFSDNLSILNLQAGLSFNIR